MLAEDSGDTVNFMFESREPVRQMLSCPKCLLCLRFWGRILKHAPCLGYIPFCSP